MKKIIYTSLLLTVLISCKKKDEPTPEPEPTPAPVPTLVTAWTWKEFDDNEDGKFSPASSGNESLTFKSDGLYSSQFSYYKIGDVTAGNDDTGTYTNTSDSLFIVSSSGKTVRAKILKLSATELWFIWQRYTSSKVEVHFNRQ
jgi:hypothetical protein